jgi:hypothetical protein
MIGLSAEAEEGVRLPGSLCSQLGGRNFTHVPPPLDNSDFRALVRMPTPLTCGFVFASRGYPQVYRVNFSVGYQKLRYARYAGVAHRHPATRCGFR